MLWKNSLNLKISLWGFVLSAFLCIPLFGGLFTTRIEYIAEHPFDTLYVLILGISIPILFLTSIIFFIISYFQYESFSTKAKVIISISSIWVVVYYFFISMKSVVDLIKMKFLF